VYLPPSYATAPARRYPVAFYLHGLTGNEADWVSLASIDVVADSLIAGGSPEMIVVMPDGDDGWYTNWEEAPQPYGACLVDTLLNRAAPALCVVQARYEDYIARDLVRHVDSTYRTLADRRHRGIAGLSMGGFGAVTLALEHPDVFSAGRVIRACCRRSLPGRIRSRRRRATTPRSIRSPPAGKGCGGRSLRHSGERSPRGPRAIRPDWRGVSPPPADQCPRCSSTWGRKTGLRTSRVRFTRSSPR